MAAGCVWLLVMGEFSDLWRCRYTPLLTQVPVQSDALNSHCIEFKNYNNLTDINNCPKNSIGLETSSQKKQIVASALTERPHGHSEVIVCSPVAVVQRTRRNRAAKLIHRILALLTGLVHYERPPAAATPDKERISALRYCRVTGLESRLPPGDAGRIVY